MTNHSEAQIIARIEELKGDLALNFKQICELLCMVKKHYLHSHYLYRWHREVASDKLTPEVVIALAGKKSHLNCLIGRPTKVQQTIAREADIDWCTVERGEVVEKRSAWTRMGKADFQRMFPPGGPVRSLQEQRQILLVEISSAPVTHIRRQPVAWVDAQASLFRLGHQTVPLSVVLLALREAGITSTEAVQAA